MPSPRPRTVMGRDSSTVAREALKSRPCPSTSHLSRAFLLFHSPLLPCQGDFGSLHPVGPRGPGSLATHLRGDGATELADEGKLVLLGVALHDRAAGPHLRHDAPSTPQVNGGAVVPLPWEEERTRRAP